VNSVESYVQELARLLHGRLPKETLESRLRETRAHLRMSTEEVGEAEALCRFGTPSSTARAILRQERRYDERSVGALSWGVGLTLALAFAIPYVWMDRGDSITGLQSQLGLWLPFLTALLFAARCLQTRRWLVLPTSLWAATGIAAIFLVSAFFPARLSPGQASQRMKDARILAERFERSARDVAAWRAGRPPLDRVPYAWKPHAMREVAGLPVPVPTDGEILYDLERFQDPQPFARAAWSKHGEALARAVTKEGEEAARWLAAAEEGSVLPLQPLGVRLRLWAIATAQITAVLLTFNALALLAGWAVDRKPFSKRSRIVG